MVTLALPLPMLDVREYEDREGRSPFAAWFSDLDATTVSLVALFETKMQLEVPLFQRQYIWQREKHWEPLWEDIARKFADTWTTAKKRRFTSSARWCSIRDRRPRHK